MNTTSGNDKSSPVYVRAWLRLFMYGLCLFAIALMIWIVLGQARVPNGNVLLAAITSGMIILCFVWLLGRLYSLCSIVLGEDGVRQSFVLHNGKFREHVHLDWDQIQRASFHKSSYFFYGENGVRLELNTTLFNDAAATIQAVRRHLPKRLLSQIDSGL
ncbi:hypothetical protein [Cupriavidus pauculus]|uniref:hypothetical protein n=1 Tax=Cupriavidus pauculus TaxID=82633 RepID=UPI001EE1FF1B|nr:hypothetical protein [Cupriavidus pauculus]GJG96679.1 hypothetical protein CBA19C6_19340 [Cupriavidus pauculus]